MVMVKLLVPSASSVSTASSYQRYANAPEGPLAPAVVAPPAAQAVFSSSARRCEKVAESVYAPQLRSQSAEDRKLLEWFNGVCDGTYVEMGALDGITFSNTYVFNKVFNWKGVLVELGPANYRSLKQNRPNELLVMNAAVCDKAKVIHYLEAGAVGGVWEFAAPSFRNMWWNGKTINDATPIDCVPLQTILDKVKKPFYADFWALDVEGAELQIVQSVDFKQSGFGIVFAEADEHNTTKNEAVRKIFTDAGYTFLMKHERSEWYVNGRFKEIYANLIDEASFPRAGL